MKKLIFLLLLFYTSSFCSSIHTLDNVKNISLYLSNKSSFLDESQKKHIKEFVKEKLLKAGFVFGETDSAVIVIKVEAKEVDSTYAIHLQLGLSEEVRTMRKDNIETFAYTYLSNTMIESDEPYEDTLEYIQFLLYEFIAAHKEDNEE